jgi:PGF-CTERM protein
LEGIREIKRMNDTTKNKKAILIFAVMLSVLVLTGTGYAMASPPAEEWNRTYEMRGITGVESFQQTADSGYILAGNMRSNAFVLKTGPTGSEQWNITFGGTFSGNRAVSVLQTSDGGYLIAGSTSACRNNCPDDVWLIKMNAQGQEQWNLTLGGNGDEEMAFVQQTADGGYILIGNTDSYGAGSFDIWFVKVDSNGNMQWNNTFGGIGQDKASSVSQVPGGYIIAGQTDSYGAGDSDFWLVKTDAKGEEQWNNTYGGYYGDRAYSLQQTHDDNYIIAGTTQSFGASHGDFLLVKTDSNGTEQWYRTFGGVGAEFNPSVRLSPDGGYILGGRTFSFDDADCWLIKTDEDGNVQWDRTFEGRGLDSFQQTPDGGYMIKGDLYDPSKTWLVQKALIKIDSNGNEQWDIRIEGDELDSVLQTGNGDYILAGIKDSKLLLVKLVMLMADRPAPSTQFTYDPGNPGANQTITFDASASFDPYGNITYYQWDLGDGSYVNTTQRTVTHSYDEGGNYIVGLTVTGSNDEVSSTTREIIVQQSGPPIMRWNKTFGGASDDWVHSLEYTSDGGYILAGSSHFFTGKGIDVDAMLVKTDLNGNMQWQRTIGGIGRDEAYSTIQTSDGGYIMVGTTESYGVGTIDFWLVKTDAKGIEQWNRTFGGEDIEEVTSFLKTLDGGYIIAGTTRPLETGSYDMWLVKTDAEGIEQWNLTLGGEDDDTRPSIRQASDGGYIIAGTTGSYGAGSDDFWLIKTDSEGIEQWNRTFGGEDYDWLYSFEQTFDGGYILGGPTRSFGNGSFDFWLVKTDNNGIEQWNRTFEGKENVIGYIASSVQQTLDGGFILEGVTGSTNSFDCWLVKTDTEGEEVWNRTFGHDEDNIPRSILQTPDGGYIIAGETGSEGPEPYDAWVFRTDADGHVQWETTFGGPGRGAARFLLLAPDGDVIVAGDRDLHSEQHTDFWLAKLGGIPAEPEGGDASTDGEPVQTPDIPGFGAAVAVIGLLFWVGLAGRRR